ncbi:MAG: outer membrane protein assembly factor BamA, partial [Chitinivibrionales bacterium]|nr:outer membrane protein assembly factor BamA [Chitinivibrionales bacterium]
MVRNTLRLLSLGLLFSSSSHAKELDTLLIDGLVGGSPAVVRNAVSIRKGEEVDGEAIQQAIRTLYRLGLFSSVDIYVENETDSTVSLLVEVEENPICEEVVFSGNKKIKERELEEKVTIRQGQVVGEAVLFRNVQALKDLYADEGYLLADIEGKLVETQAPGYVDVKFEIDEGKRVRIEEITFKGNTEFSDRKLKRKFKTNEDRFFTSGDYDEQLYHRHLDSLILFYRDKGYLDAHVVRDSVWYAENKEDIFIEIELSEGPKYYVGDFFFTGNKVLDVDQLASHVALKKGKPFEKTKFDMTKGLLGNAYREEGYLWAQVEDERRYRGDTIDVTFQIVEGLPAIVRKIDVIGNTKTREKVIRRELVLYPGQKYRQSRMERSIREVMQLNYFDDVAPDLRPNSDGTIDLVFNVVEKENIGQFSAGIMFSQLDGFGGNFGISIPNFRGAGQQLDASVEWAMKYQKFSFGFSEPWAFDTPTRLSGNLFYSRQEYYGDEYQSFGLELGAGRRLKWPDDYFSAYLNYRLSHEDVTRSLDTVGNMIFLNEGLLSRLRFTLERNDTDVPMFPNSGSIFFLTTEMAGLGGDYNYLKATTGYNWYFPLWWKFVLSTKTKFGLLGGFNDTLSLLRTDVFAAGNVLYDGVIRGYDQDFGGVYDPGNGVAMFTWTTELRFPILERQM